MSSLPFLHIEPLRKFIPQNPSSSVATMNPSQQERGDQNFI
jgi:hypothetical protein